eukprot:scaffold13987_cov132-Cylindrotheca_fusiformis.AAC.3
MDHKRTVQGPRFGATVIVPANILPSRSKIWSRFQPKIDKDPNNAAPELQFLIRLTVGTSY